MKEFAEKIINAAPGKTHLISLGQAGFIIKSKNGQMLAIDPYLSDCVENMETEKKGFKRLLPKILFPDELSLDVLICTHFHRDHYDVDAVPGLMANGKTHLFCPADCLEDIERDDIQNYEIVKPGTNIKYGDFNMHFINCDHGTGAPLAVGVIVEVDGIRLLNVGDSCLRIDRKDEYLSFGEIDVMIAPINGKYGNLDYQDYFKLAQALRPKLSIPAHYGMFADHGGNLLAFYETFKNSNLDFLIMTLGEDYVLN